MEYREKQVEYEKQRRAERIEDFWRGPVLLALGGFGIGLPVGLIRGCNADALSMDSTTLLVTWAGCVLLGFMIGLLFSFRGWYL